MVDVNAIGLRVRNALSSVGGIATFTVVGNKDYDAESGTVDASGTQLLSAVVSPPLAYSSRYKDSSAMREGSSLFVLAAKGLKFTPVQGMHFTYGGEGWVILSLKQHTINTTVLAYELEASRG